MNESQCYFLECPIHMRDKSFITFTFFLFVRWIVKNARPEAKISRKFWWVIVWKVSPTKKKNIYILLQNIHKLNKSFKWLFQLFYKLSLNFTVWFLKSTWLKKGVSVALFFLVTVLKTFTEDTILSYHFKNFAPFVDNLYSVVQCNNKQYFPHLFWCRSSIFSAQRTEVPFIMWEWCQEGVNESGKGKEIRLGIRIPAPTPGKMGPTFLPKRKFSFSFLLGDSYTYYFQVISIVALVFPILDIKICMCSPYCQYVRKS